MEVKLKDLVNEQLFPVWWKIVCKRTSAIFDKLKIAEYFNQPVGPYGETSIPELITQKNIDEMRIMEEALARICKFPENEMGEYPGIKNNLEQHRAYVQRVIWSVYNIGIETGIDAIKILSSKYSKE